MLHILLETFDLGTSSQTCSSRKLRMLGQRAWVGVLGRIDTICPPPCVPPIPHLYPQWMSHGYPTVSEQHVMSCHVSDTAPVTSASCSMAEPGQGNWKFHPLGAIGIENLIVVLTVFTRQSLSEVRSLPWATPRSAGEIAWPGGEKDLDFLAKGYVVLGGDRRRQSELGGSHQAGARPRFVAWVEGLPGEAFEGLADSPQASRGRAVLPH